LDAKGIVDRERPLVESRWSWADMVELRSTGQPLRRRSGQAARGCTYVSLPASKTQ
jgi:hypothetical protein